MDLVQNVNEQEKKYLYDTVSFIQKRLEIDEDEIKRKKEDLIESQRNIYANSSNNYEDMTKMSENLQQLAPLVIQQMEYQAAEQHINLYKKMLKEPYFARIDFSTDNWGLETIYIGMGNLEDEENLDVYVYDWRAPISSVFYRYELGKASYKAPVGTIEGVVTLKRQYEIENGKLKFFFDSGVNILDDILKEALSQNTSKQMRTIVETIQREQDIIIRDIDSDLLIVQGVAGSGKTSIALHRAAYLMYNGLASHLSAKNMLLISPNHLFEQYISQVLPELGEENIKALTFEDIFKRIFGDKFDIMPRKHIMEEILSCENSQLSPLYLEYKYKTSSEFVKILDWLSEYYLRKVIRFPDIMYDGHIVIKGDLLKSRVLSSKNKGLSIKVRLELAVKHVSELLKALRKERLKDLEHKISEIQSHSFDYKSVARLVVMKEFLTIINNLKETFTLNSKKIYEMLFANNIISRKAAAKFPAFTPFIEQANSSLNPPIGYNDAMAILYLELSLGGKDIFTDIRQVVVDEAQDYSVIHFEILKKLFPSAKYTVLGDINQTIIDTNSDSLYSDIDSVLQKKNTNFISLTKSFRCSYEISKFSSHFSDNNDIDALERHDDNPIISRAKTDDELTSNLVNQINIWIDSGCGSISVICKNFVQAQSVYDTLNGRIPVSLGVDNSVQAVTVLPVYLAKGLEFDAVAVYNVNESNYYSESHRRLLYIVCTRALHKLGVFYVGKASKLLPTK